MALSERQQAILDYIRKFLRENEYPPSIREIMHTLGISSTSVVNYNLNALVREGCITRRKELARGIRLVDGTGFGGAAQSLMRVPVLGRIVAGEPVPVPEGGFDPSQYIELTRDIVNDESEIYALEVSGESMIDALINDGDIVVMLATNTIEDGAMAAVWLKREQEVTLKMVYREPGRIRLQPANPYMEPFYHDPENVEIQGKVLGVIRRLASFT